MLHLQTTERIRHAARNAALCLDKDVSFCNRLHKNIPGLNDATRALHKQHEDADPTRKTSIAGAMEENIDSFEEISTSSTMHKPSGVPLGLLEELSRRMLAYERSIGMTVEKSQYWLHELLRGSGVIIHPPLPAPPQNPALAARLEAIRVEQANREYAHMVRDVAPGFGHASGYHVDDGGNDVYEARQAQRQLVAILNVLFSVAGVFTAVYWTTGMVTKDIAMRVLWAILISLAVAAAEAWLYVRYFNQASATTRNRGHSIIEQARRHRDGYQAINS
ncbi:endoplasmic reticulum-based factor for assembly of V-ATPase-domain-containing protein [Syncephalis pseudoplumigaleata]|uniref:Endoplasmic reticulum-based factor for assembly of V-ATPase-domain-containing protein n=1 Tax=Syncephalis pseudoplumigaleata TaxID=1712513 RepID=A0A4P9Z4P9_9FUNG|nr:endoplasmic reticulum-based factor for assembly of V-ATPase-domain-containing protein [Syncephalis pseudoplumigaleata]|eukprot:RKP27564.1 endoplasmic reticulum-based factor for assembly of V-ATPase-domain-containing protein [Syncephalis pseudoplumigaleata]